MKTTIQINGNPVVIELTPEQVEAVKKASIKITDRVKTFEDACNELSVNPSAIAATNEPDVFANDIKSILAYKKLIVIVRALNEGWEPNWNNSDEYKYYPWFDMRAGFGFSGTHCDDWSADTAVGSRLCFKSSELALYAGRQFKELYKDFLTL